MRATTILVAALLAAMPFQSACSARQRIKAETAVADMLISRKQEKQIGKQLHAELEKEGLRYVEDGEVQAYVEGIAADIKKRVNRKENVRDLHVHVVDEPGVVNAMATPGGHVYVFSGLLLDADNQAEVASVVAHEMGHVVGRHSARQMVYAYGYSALASLALGKNPGLLQQIAATVVGQGFMSAHSRSEESEADRLGVHWLSRAGWDPEAAVTFFQKLKEQEGRTPAVAAWFSTHPTTSDRIAELREMIRKDNLSGRELGVEEHQRIVQKLEGGSRPRGREGEGRPLSSR